MTASTISNSFAPFGFTEEVVPEQKVEPDVLSQPGDEYKELLGVVSWDNYIIMDDDTITPDTASEDWLAVITPTAKGDEDYENDSGDDDQENRPQVTSRDSLEHVNMVNFAFNASDDTILDAASRVEHLLQGHCIRQAALAKQKTITDFFTSKLMCQVPDVSTFHVHSVTVM